MSNPFREKCGGVLFDIKHGGKAAADAIPELQGYLAKLVNFLSPENITAQGQNLAKNLTKDALGFAGDFGKSLAKGVGAGIGEMGQNAWNNTITPFLKAHGGKIGGGAAAAAGLYGGYKGLKYYLKRRAANLAHQRAVQLAEAPTKNIVQQIKGLGGNLQTSADAINAQLQNISNSINGRQFGRDLVLGAGEGLGQLGSQAFNMAKDKLNQLGQGINNYRINTINPFVSQHKNALIGAGAATGLGLGGYGLYNRLNNDN